MSCEPSPQLLLVLTFLWVCSSSNPVPELIVSPGSQGCLSPPSFHPSKCHRCHLPWYRQQSLLQHLVSLDILCNLKKVPLIFDGEIPFSTYILEVLKLKDDAVVSGFSGTEYSNT